MIHSILVEVPRGRPKSFLQKSILAYEHILLARYPKIRLHLALCFITCLLFCLLHPRNRIKYLTWVRRQLAWIGGAAHTNPKPSLSFSEHSKKIRLANPVCGICVQAYFIPFVWMLLHNCCVCCFPIFAAAFWCVRAVRCASVHCTFNKLYSWNLFSSDSI